MARKGSRAKGAVVASSHSIESSSLIAKTLAPCPLVTGSPLLVEKTKCIPWRTHLEWTKLTGIRSSLIREKSFALARETSFSLSPPTFLPGGSSSGLNALLSLRSSILRLGDLRLQCNRDYYYQLIFHCRSAGAGHEDGKAGGVSARLWSVRKPRLSTC